MTIVRLVQVEMLSFPPDYAPSSSYGDAISEDSLALCNGRTSMRVASFLLRSEVRLATSVVHAGKTNRIGSSSSKGSGGGKGSTASFVDAALAEHKLVVFSKTWCGFCARAKNLFKSIGADAHIVEIDERPDEQKIQDYLMGKSGKRSVPSIWLAGNFLGGCDDVHSLHAREKLVQMLKDAGVSVKG